MSVSVKQTLHDAIQKLPSDSASLDAELLLCHVLDVNRAWLRTWPEKDLSTEQQSKFAALLSRRAKGEPVAYLIGSQEFWSLVLKVTPATLIPRPETELLVEQALEKLHGISSPVVLDLGTGSGAIALAIASERPDALVIASDRSFAALEVAQNNAFQLNLHNVYFVNASWATCFTTNRFDLIVSNPPYIEREDPDLSPQVLEYEPLHALIAAEEGLADIRTIAQQAHELLKPGAWLLFEHGWKQSREVKKILQSRGFSKTQTLQDLAGHDRVTIANKESE